jgi:hypothetical protein
MAPRDAQRAALKVALTDSPLFRPGAIRAALRDLRRHRLSPSDDFDAARSVLATVQAGGFVRLVKARRPVLPDYILLIDRLARDDHMGELAQVLAARLKADQFRVVRGEFRGDPRIVTLVSETGRERRDLEDLANDYPDARLLMVADVASFWDPVREDWRAWVTDLQAFGATAVLSPTARAQWGVRERELAAMGFLLTPATSDGLVSLADQLRTETRLQSPRETQGHGLDLLLAADPYRWTGDHPPSEAETAELLAALEQTLAPAAFLHLCALAVFPAVHPRLTEQIGQALTNAEGVVVLSEENYAALSRLPWLRRGRIPDWLRRALLLALKPGDAERVRAVWTRALEPTPVGEEAALDLDVVKPRPAEKAVRRLLTSMIRSGQAPPVMSEALLLAFLEGRRLPELGIAAPRRLWGEGRLGLPRPEIVDFAALLAAMAVGIGDYVLAPLASAWLQSAPTPAKIGLFLVAVLLGPAAVGWRLLRGRGWGPTVTATAALAFAVLMGGVAIELGALLGGVAVAALVWTSAPPFWRRQFDGLDLGRLFAGDRWQVTAAMTSGAALLALGPFALGMAWALKSNGAAVLLLTLASLFTGAPIAVLAQYFAPRLQRDRVFALSVGALFAGVTTVFGVGVLLPAAIATSATGLGEQVGRLFGVDLATSVPMFALLWILGRGTVRLRTAIALALSSAVIVSARDAILGDQVFGPASALAAASLMVTPVTFWSLAGGRFGSGAGFKAVACTVAIDLAGAMVLALAPPGAGQTLWPLVAWVLPAAATWPALRWTRPDLWRTAPAAATAVRPRLAGLSPWSLAFLLLSPTYALGDFSLSPAVLALPLAVFLAQRHPLRSVRAWAALGAAPMLVVIDRPGLGLSSNVGLYAVLLLLPRLVRHPDALRAWLRAGRLDLLQIAFLLLALGAWVSISVRLGPRVNGGLDWTPLLLQVLLLFLVGLSDAPLRRFWLIFAPAAVAGIATGLMLSQKQILLGGVQVAIGAPLDSLAVAACAAAAAGCGRALRPVLRAELTPPDPQVRLRTRRPWLGLLVPIAMILMVVTLAPGGRAPSSRLLDDYALLVLAPLAAFNARRAAQAMMGGTALLLFSVGLGFGRHGPRLGALQLNITPWELLALAPTALAALLIMELVIRAAAARGFGDPDGDIAASGGGYSEAYA